MPGYMSPPETTPPLINVFSTCLPQRPSFSQLHHNAKVLAFFFNTLLVFFFYTLLYSPRDPPSANSITMQKYLPITNIAISYCGHRYWLSRTSVENTLIRGGVVTNIAISYCGHRYWLLRTSVENTLIRGGVVTNIAISYCGHRYWLRTSQCKST
jgi:uncharacterized Zn-finger protein